jgi:hypothetical protein
MRGSFAADRLRSIIGYVKERVPLYRAAMSFDAENGPNR